MLSRGRGRPPDAILSTRGPVIGGRVASCGRVPSADGIARWLMG
jgi:hypothetical protein